MAGNIYIDAFAFSCVESDRHGSGDMRRLQEEIEGLTVSIKRRTQRLYSQTGETQTLGIYHVVFYYISLDVN